MREFKNEGMKSNWHLVLFGFVSRAEVDRHSGRM